MGHGAWSIGHGVKAPSSHYAPLSFMVIGSLCHLVGVSPDRSFAVTGDHSLWRPDDSEA